MCRPTSALQLVAVCKREEKKYAVICLTRLTRPFLDWDVMYRVVNVEDKSFRGDIESLRGVCVMFVIAYHLFPEHFPSGFVGVDCFFVISGFVITSSIMKTVVDRGSFALGPFFSRRFKRLSPASTALTYAVILYAFAFDWQRRRVAEDVSYSTVFSANIHFYLGSGDYFQSQTSPSPMLHFWSLAVEEQFYGVYAIMVWCLERMGGGKRAVMLCTALLASLSLSFSIALVWSGRESAAFYLTPFRFWEMAVGCMAALAKPHLSILSSSFGSAGVFVIVCSMTLTPESPFPGLGALPVVVGTLVVMISEELTWLSDLQWLRFAGRVSYSLYLWHWPVITMVNVGRVQRLILSFILSVVSGTVVEPFGKRLKRKGVFFACVATLMTVPIAWWSAASTPAFDRTPPTRETNASYASVTSRVAFSVGVPKFNDVIPRFQDLARDIERHDSGILRVLGDGRGESRCTIFLTGDSHASQNVFFGVREFSRSRGCEMFLSYRSSCPFPANGYGDGGYIPPDGCSEYRQGDWAFIKSKRPWIVVTSNSEAGKVGRIMDAYREARQRVEGTGNVKFLVLQDNPRTIRHDEELRQGKQVVFEAKNTPSSYLSDVWFVRTRGLYCDPLNRCPLIVDGMVTTGDGNHLTLTYAKYISPAIRELMDLAVS